MRMNMQEKTTCFTFTVLFALLSVSVSAAFGKLTRRRD